MEISCPNCTNRYEIDASVIPDSGRKVQCSVCENRWRIFPDAPQKNKKLRERLRGAGHEGVAIPDDIEPIDANDFAVEFNDDIEIETVDSKIPVDKRPDSKNDDLAAITTAVENMSRRVRTGEQPQPAEPAHDSTEAKQDTADPDELAVDDALNDLEQARALQDSQAIEKASLAEPDSAHENAPVDEETDVVPAGANSFVTGFLFVLAVVIILTLLRFVLPDLMTRMPAIADVGGAYIRIFDSIISSVQSLFR